MQVVLQVAHHHQRRRRVGISCARLITYYIYFYQSYLEVSGYLFIFSYIFLETKVCTIKSNISSENWTYRTTFISRSVVVTNWDFSVFIKKGNWMKSTLFSIIGASLFVTFAHAELPSPAPISRDGSCPSNYSMQGNYCVPSNGARFTIFRHGSCPSNYTSSGAYCVADSGARLAIPNPDRRSCPSGYTSSGYYCVSPN